MEKNNPPQFLCYGTKDFLVDPKGVIGYKAVLDDKGVKNKMLEVKGANHGFGNCDGSLLEKLMFGKYSYWKKEFVDWANTVFEGLSS